MKIATFNVNGINGRLPILLDWLAATRPDAVVLQELKCQQADFPIGAIEAAGYGAIWAGQKRWNGVAILAWGLSPSRRGGGCRAIPIRRRAGTSRRRSAGY